MIVFVRACGVCIRVIMFVHLSTIKQTSYNDATPTAVAA
jgi:hypothetical protein